MKNLYYPVQIPYILSKEFSENIKYSEEIALDFENFVICFWEMQSVTEQNKSTIENIIITDGCIDLVVDFTTKQIGFSGMNKTEFHYRVNLPFQSMGARFKPGAFYAITSIPATEAMNTFLPLKEVDKSFNDSLFFSLPFFEAKDYFKNYVGVLVKDKTVNEFVTLFDRFCEDVPKFCIEFYKMLHFSARQCQRLFLKNFGMSPQLVLCVLRFQKCLKLLTSKSLSPGEILDTVKYYDQSHFIKDFKRNIGLTPVELIRKYSEMSTTK